MALWVLLLTSLALHSHGRTAEAQIVSSAEAQVLTDSYFDFKIRENPWFASSLGLDKYQDKIEEWNHAAFNRRIAESRTLRTQADALLARGEFESRQDEIGIKIMKDSLDVFLRGAEFRNYTVTLNGELSALPDFLRLEPIPSYEKLVNWHRRVLGLQTLFDDQLILMDQAISTGLTKAKYNVEAWIDSLRKAVSNSTDNFFAFQPWIYLNIATINSSFYEEGKRDCDTLRQKMETYTNKIERDYLPVARDYDHEGVSHLPGGADFYTNTLRYYTLPTITPQYVHQLGLSETLRITDEMKKIVAGEGFAGTVREYTNLLLSQPEETFPTREALLEGYNQMLKTKLEPKMSQEFEPADTGVDVIIVDDPYGSGGSYFNPSYNESSGGFNPGRFMYDGREPTQILKAGMLPLLLHETVPGHHYQISYSLKVAPLPNYRRYIDFSHYDQDGFKFDSFTPYVEGWGLYSEFLGGPGMLGVIETEKERLGQLSYESLRAARLVVDTGLHFYNWTRERAEDYLKDSTILSDSECVSEIKRYIRWPGQACAYKIGELKLKELRTTAQNKLGDGFNPREFHNVILELGPAPLSLVEQEVNVWISKKSAVTSSVSTLYVSYLCLLITCIFNLL